MSELISGRYEPLRVLGTSNADHPTQSARVVEVRDRVLGGPPRALKRLPAAQSSQALDEFRRLRAFRHPGIPEVGELGLDPASGELFFTSELARGTPFLVALRTASRDVQLRAIADLLRTLALLDERGLVHRDLKPDHLLVEGDGDPRVLLIDFGLAASGPARDVAGSLAWLAPELFRGEPASHRSDLYALGVVLFELWAGRPPFFADSPTGWARAHCDQPVAFPPAAVPGAASGVAAPGAVFDAPLREFVARLLEKDPKRRTPHASEALADLSRNSRVPLPRSTPRDLLGRVRSVPRFDPPWRETLEPGDTRKGGPLTWVTAPTRAGRDELVRDLRAAAVVGEAFPIVVSFAVADPAALEPRQALLEQVRALAGDAGRGRTDEDHFAILKTGALPRRAVLFLEEVDRCRPEDEGLLQHLLRAQIELVVSSESPPHAPATGLELRTLEPRPISAREIAAAFPSWVGGALPDPLARFLGVEQDVDAPRLVQTLAWLVESGALAVDDDGVRFDPSRVDLRDAGADLRDVLRRRVAQVRGKPRDVLEALAVAEVGIDRAELTALVPECDDATLASLVVSGLLEREGDLHRCASGGVAAAARESIAPERARELDRRAAAHLAKRPDAPDSGLRRARHAFRADRNATNAAALSRAGIELLTRHRLADAESVARELEREDAELASPSGPAAEARTTARLVRGVVELRRGSHADAERLLAPLAESAADPALRGRALVEHARALYWCGRHLDALARLENAPRPLFESAPGARALRAFVLHELQRDAEAEAACREALAQPVASPDEPTHKLRAMLAVSLWRLDRPEEARRAFEQAIADARKFEQPVAVAAIENNFARFEGSCGRLSIAVEIFRRALATSAAFLDRQLESAIAGNLAITLVDLGRFGEAKRELERARVIAHSMQQPTKLRRIALEQAQLALDEGDLAGAHAALDESLRVARESGDARGVWLGEVVRSDVLVREGRLKAARVLLRRLADEPIVRGSPELASYLAEYELSWATFGGSRAAVERAFAQAPSLPNSPKRRARMRDARIAALFRLGRRAELATESERQLEELAPTEFVAQRAHAAAALAFAQSGRVAPAASRAASEQARAALAAVREPGLAVLRAQAALVLGLATGDALLIEEAETLSRRCRHVPLTRRASRERRRLAASAGGGAAEAARLSALERLMAVAKEISATTDGEALLRFVLDHAIDATRARRGFLILERDGELSVRAARNLAAADIERPELAFSSSVAREVARDGRPVLLSDVSADDRFRGAASISQLKLISVLCVPLRGTTAVVGSIYLDDPTRIDAFSERELRYVEELSDFASIALEKAELLHANRERQTELEKKQDEITELNSKLQGALLENQGELKEARASLEKARRQVARTLEFEGIVSQSGVMEEVRRKIELFADSELPVFISGESGTGKELVARALHKKSARRAKPYESLNCASMQPQLIENELFGHLRGAFTGADADRPGLFERVDGGTLFLDEVCDAPTELQAKLLRVVQFGEVQRLGGGPVRAVDVRIVAASNRDVQKEVAAGRFREDLMYRLVVLSVRLPTLRERREDIPLLIEHFERRHGPRMKSQPLLFSAPAWKLFVAYAWPGNVRELENAVQRLLVLHRDGEEIGLEDLSSEVPAAVEGAKTHALPLREFVDEQERAYILEVLARHDGNRARAAKDLGISERNLYHKLQRFRDGGGPQGDVPGPTDARGAAG